MFKVVFDLITDIHALVCHDGLEAGDESATKKEAGVNTRDLPMSSLLTQY